ncbi:adenylate/guanylate cyclase domain-containing protein [Rubrivirga sp. IMCC43871]|uniref:adenylate/guanylate cyclase domain-containing protein n=1 Tax=Rubrivirga sp. IMCC43871 TaxID=3391575 RepID=UPI003990199F
MTVGRVRRALRLAPFLIVCWSVAAFLAANVSGVAWSGFDTPGVQIASPAQTLLRSLAIGAIVGLISAWLETAVLPRPMRALPLWGALVVRTVTYAIAVQISMVAVIATLGYVVGGLSPSELRNDPAFLAFAESGVLFRFMVFLLASSFVVNLMLQLRRVLGPETLRALFLGTYRRPRHEERAFAFLDLTDSTVWAERLGPLAFTDFKNDFFADVAEPVLATGGRIVQYVGDEVMVSWPMKRAEHDAAPLRFYFLVEARVAARADRYRDRYGAVPAFKCGVHGGEVVTAEVGDLKRDIVHSGDVVNTAARIEGECRPRGHRLLISDEMLARMPSLAEATHTALGPAALRGKSQSVGLVAVTRAG